MVLSHLVEDRSILEKGNALQLYPQARKMLGAIPHRNCILQYFLVLKPRLYKQDKYSASEATFSSNLHETRAGNNRELQPCLGSQMQPARFNGAKLDDTQLL